jgi:putative membrane protein
MIWRRTRGAALLVIFAAGCARFRAEANRPERPPEGPTDGNIAAFLLAANNTDISYAQLVPGRTSDPAIQGFARRMITDHSAVNTAVTELIARTPIKPAEYTASLEFRDESTARRDQLRALTGRSFDSAYVAGEIELHTRLLRTLDTELIPRARDLQLRQILVSVRPAVAGHLEHAKALTARTH